MISDANEALVGLNEHYPTCCWMDKSVAFCSRKALPDIMKRKSCEVSDSKKRAKTRPFLSNGGLTGCNGAAVALQQAPRCKAIAAPLQSREGLSLRCKD